jgi:hypothetical protein
LASALLQASSDIPSIGSIDGGLFGGSVSEEKPRHES